jgi:CTP synthase
MGCLYEVPLALEEEGLAKEVLARLGLPQSTPDLKEWAHMVHSMKASETTVKVALAGKYTGLSDAYLSVIESLRHAAASQSSALELVWVDTEECTTPAIVAERLKDVAAVVVPGGFGHRGIEGKIQVIQYAREHQLPFLGLCLGMQCAVIEFARNVVGIDDADSAEFQESLKHPVIDIMEEQKSTSDKGGTMRLGQYPCHLQKNSLAATLYEAPVVMERHRHRFEVNNDYRDRLVAAGLVISGTSPDRTLVEIVELPNHPYFIASQFHPEFKSRPNRPHPLFKGLIQAALNPQAYRSQSQLLEERV